MKIKRVFCIMACLEKGKMDEAERFFKDVLGAKIGPECPDLEPYGHRVKGAWLGTEVPFRVELAESINDELSIGRQIKKVAPAFQFLGVEVENIDEAIKELRAKGIRVSNKVKMWSLYTSMIHPKSAFGLIIELMQFFEEHPPDREW